MRVGVVRVDYGSNLGGRWEGGMIVVMAGVIRFGDGRYRV